MKKLFLIATALLITTGCVNTAKLVRELKNDPATVRFNVKTIYGTAELLRIGGTTNSVTVQPDGTVQIRKPQE